MKDGLVTMTFPGDGCHGITNETNFWEEEGSKGCATLQVSLSIRVR